VEGGHDGLLVLGLVPLGALGQDAGKSAPGKKAKAPAGGYVAFEQKGAYLVDCRVTWKQPVKDKKTGKSKLADKEWTWKKARTASSKKCDLPPGATAVKVSVKVYVFPDKLKDIKLDPKEFAAPPRVTYRLTGTTLNAKAEGILAK
jgi:hypothetical protein